MVDYLNYAKSLFDSLIQSGATIDDDELISYVLDGLSLEYKELATKLHLHLDIDFDQFYDLAIREEHLQKRMSLTLTSAVAMAADRVPSTFSIQTCLVTITITILIKDLEEDAVMARIGIKGVDQGEQGIGGRLKVLGF